MNRCAQIILVISAASGFLFCRLSSVCRCKRDRIRKLIEAAKDEGKVAYYTTMTLSQSKKVADKFQRNTRSSRWICFASGADESAK